jgi:hypothetical protein
MVVDGKSYVAAANSRGTIVHVRERSKETGTLRLRLFSDRRPTVQRASAGFVSDLGEFVTLESFDSPATLPVGRYRISTLHFELRDGDGRVWAYWFDGDGPCNIVVSATGSDERVLLAGLMLGVQIERGRDDSLRSACPRLATDAGLELTNCEVRTKSGGRTESRSARVTIRSSRGRLLTGDAYSGFA